MALGAIADWKDLYAYYNDVNKYTAQLRGLGKGGGKQSQGRSRSFPAGVPLLDDWRTR